MATGSIFEFGSYGSDFSNHHMVPMYMRCERQQQQQQQQQQRIVPVQYRKRPSNRKEFLDYRYNDRVPSQMPIYVTVYSCTHKNADETKR
jgi:hypothetical protein